MVGLPWIELGDPTICGVYSAGYPTFSPLATT